MSQADLQDTTALCHAARDTARHIATMAEDLDHLRHSTSGESRTLIERQYLKLRDHLTLLTAIVGDIERGLHAP